MYFILNLKRSVLKTRETLLKKNNIRVKNILRKGINYRKKIHLNLNKICLYFCQITNRGFLDLLFFLKTNAACRDSNSNNNNKNLK